MPVIGFLQSASLDGITDLVRGFHQGLKDTGYVEGENVAIEYRFADNQLDRLPALAADLVRRRVAVIVTGSPPPAIAAKAATTTIPIVFGVAEDPVRLGLVTSLARPGGNLTGINFFSTELVAKRLELLREMVPGAARVAVLINPANAATYRVDVGETWSRLPAPCGCKFRCSTPTPAGKSMRPLQILGVSGLTPSSSALALSSTPDVSK